MWILRHCVCVCVFLSRRDLRNLLPPASTMNVFDRNINIDALFTFSQMCVRCVHTLQRSPCGVLAFSRFTADSVLQISVHAAAPEECVLQPGAVHVCGRRRLLRPRGHRLLSGDHLLTNATALTPPRPTGQPASRSASDTSTCYHR